MSFEFLAPDAARNDGGEAPPARSPIEWVHRGAGASFAERAGWRVVAGYGAGDAAACRDAVGVADLSHIGKLELQGDPQRRRLDRLRADRRRRARARPGGAPGRRLVVSGEQREGPGPDASRGDRSAPRRARVGRRGCRRLRLGVELTAALGSNAVVGPLAREAFARATALDLRPERFGEGAFAPVSVARTPAMVLRTEGDRFLHLFGAGYASYVWTVFVDAAEHLGGAAVGAEALEGRLRAGGARRCVRSSASAACGGPRGELRDRYDVVIIGGGSHGLAIAYYLARDHGITDVCVLEKSYIGSGAAGRNTTILRSNYKTPEGARFYDASVKLYEGLGAELDFNLLFSQQGHLTLAHTDRAMFVMNERAEVNRLAGIDSRVIGPEEIAAARAGDVPRARRRLSGDGRALPPARRDHPPRRRGLGLARAADAAGAEIHPYTEVAGVELSGNGNGNRSVGGRRACGSPTADASPPGR